MARWHGYIAIENVGLNATQRQILIDEIKELGPGSDPQPAKLNHWRIRLDSEAGIFEANFNEDNLTVEVFKQRLANIFGVDPSTIDHVIQQISYGPMVTFSRNSVDRLRFLAFAGVNSAWMESGDEARRYLKNNQSDWEPEI